MHCNIGIEQNTTGMTHLKVDLAILLMDAGRSLIQMRKSKGPSTDPCGTPRLVIFHEEDSLFALFSLITVLWYLLPR